MGGCTFAITWYICLKIFMAVLLICKGRGGGWGRRLSFKKKKITKQNKTKRIQTQTQTQRGCRVFVNVNATELHVQNFSYNPTFVTCICWPGTDGGGGVDIGILLVDFVAAFALPPLPPLPNIWLHLLHFLVRAPTLSPQLYAAADGGMVIII